MKANQITGQLVDWERGDDSVIEGGVPMCNWINKLDKREIYLPDDVKPTLEMIYAAVLYQRSETRETVSHDVLELPQDDSATDRIALILSGNEKDVKAEVKVYRVKQDGKDSFCYSYKPSDFENGDLSIIQKQFGAGTYRIRVYATDAISNKFVLRANQVIEIEQPLISIDDKNGNSENGFVQIMLRHMENSDKRFEQLTQQLTQRSEQSLTEKLQEMKLLKEVFGGETQPRDDVFTMLKKMQQLRDHKDLIFPDTKEKESENSELISLGEKGISLISSLMSQSNQTQNQNAQRNLSNAQQIPTMKIPKSFQQSNQVQQITPSQPDMSETDKEMILVKQMINVLILKAKEKADVSPIADDVADYLTDQVWDELEKDSWFEYLCNLVPECREYETWFHSLRDVLLEPAPDDLDQVSDNVIPLGNEPK